MHYSWRLALIFLLGFFLDCVNIFMSAIALPAIAQDLSVAQTWIGWVSTSYILGLTLAMPLSLLLANKFGPRWLLSGSMLLFAVAAFGSSVSGSFLGLLGWRFTQGFAGGLLIPIGQALVFSHFTGASRNKISVLIMAVALIAPAFSPLLGGALVDYFSWRWIFFSSLPIALLTAILAWLWVRAEPLTKKQTLDIYGLVLVSLALLALLLFLSIYAEVGFNYLSSSLLCLAVLASYGYWRYQKKYAALVDLSLLANLKLRICITLYHAVPGIFTAVNLLAIFYLQQQFAFSAKQTGSFMLLYAIGALICMLKSSRWLAKFTAKKCLTLGLITHSLGILLLALTPNNAHSIYYLAISYLLMGAGGGLVAVLAQTLALSDFSAQKLEKASVLWNINRQLAFSFGVALSALLFSLAQRFTDDMQAYQLSFICASVLGLSALLVLRKLSHQHE